MTQGAFHVLSKFSFLCLFILVLAAAENVENSNNSEKQALTAGTDLDTSSTSAKLFNLGSLFGQTPNYPYGYGSNYPGNSYRPGYYPTTSGGYYPSTYYASTGWNSGSYYPNSGGSYYPTNGGGYYPAGSGYYPTTNILGGGNGGYGGYGGNGGLRQYSGYLSSDYNGHRNRGYGYFTDTDRNGLPQRGWRGGISYGRERDRVPSAYRGYY